MSRSVNCFEDVNGEGHFFGDSLFCLRRTPVGVGSWGGDSGQGNFELAANSDYNSRGSADPRESLRKRRISKLALSARKMPPLHDPTPTG